MLFYGSSGKTPAKVRTVVYALVINCGSSSVKFQIIETDQDRIRDDADRRLAWGSVERIGGHALITLAAEGRAPVKADAPLRDHREALDRVLRWIVSDESKIDEVRSVSDIDAVGHRVVHGGERFQTSVRIDDEVIRKIEDCTELAPLHNPANLKGIRAARELLGPGVRQVAVFDTAFHSAMPAASYLYGIPYHLYRHHKIRRYGFHGTSHRYVAYRYRKILGLEREQVNIVTLHLGNGCSACAIREGNSVDTSMGFTPLEGLLMGTRSGDVDPTILEYLTHKEGMTVYEVDAMLNKHSGLLGISGLSGDMRDLLEEVEENQDRRASLAVDVFCYRIRKYVGAYHVALGGADAVVFAGGIGENSPSIRKQVCDGLGVLGVRLDDDENAALPPGGEGRISREDSAVAAWVIPSNEELLIARDTFRVVTGAPRRW